MFVMMVMFSFVLLITVRIVMMIILFQVSGEKEIG